MSKKATPLYEILAGKHPNYSTFELKKRLIRAGILEDKCCICGMDTNRLDGAEFTTNELDHIDGDPTNHDIENLRILCPTCHSLTRNYRNRKNKEGINYV